MKVSTILVSAALAVTAQSTWSAEDPADVGSVVDAVKAASSDMKALCQSGPEAIRKLVSEKTRELAMAGKLKGNPQAVGAEAGQKIGQECRG